MITIQIYIHTHLSCLLPVTGHVTFQGTKMSRQTPNHQCTFGLLAVVMVQPLQKVEDTCKSSTSMHTWYADKFTRAVCVTVLSANLRCHQLRGLTKSQDWCVQSDTIRQQHPGLGTTEESNIVIAGVSQLMAIT